ncbi:MAG: Peptidyl-prolyl cis-trans isomerase cyp8 [Watsoniomyces obsoletus]|nr:MAG: Peptidyl-prolyl cis-trans isomerase cyp8 [Watsoniomyces obsoletus]
MLPFTNDQGQGDGGPGEDSSRRRGGRETSPNPSLFSETHLNQRNEEPDNAGDENAGRRVEHVTQELAGITFGGQGRARRTNGRRRRGRRGQGASGVGLPGHHPVVRGGTVVAPPVAVYDDTEVWAAGEDPGLLVGAAHNVAGAAGPNTVGVGIAHPGRLGSRGPSPVPGPAGRRHRLLIRRTGQVCPTIVGSKLRELLQLTDENVLVTADLMTENAGRNIAQLVHEVVEIPGVQVGATIRQPKALVLVGNNVTGMRAAAAARHLNNHGWNVRVCIVRPQNPNEQTLHELGRQSFRLAMSGSGGTDRANPVTAIEEETRRGLDVIIDGIFGPDASQVTIQESKNNIARIARAIESSNVQVISVGMPTGIHGSIGSYATAADGTNAYIKAHHVITMGAPTLGLLFALRDGVDLPGKIYVADVGISRTIWRDHCPEYPEGVPFRFGWIEELVYDDAGVNGGEVE